MELAVQLADRFTVHIPDSHGRGLSGPHGNDFGLPAAAEDLAAVLAQSGARRVFGLSAGAIPVLRAALDFPSDYRVALYEPPLPTDGYDPVAWLGRYEREMRAGDLAAAMVTIARGTRDAGLLRLVPRFVAVPAMRLALREDAKDATRRDAVALRDLIPTMRHDAQVVQQSGVLLDAAVNVECSVLLLGGSRSPRYLAHALDALERALPNVQRVELKGLGHLAADNGGDPRRVAEPLRRFFVET